MTELRFVLAPGQNQFFEDVCDALCSELADLGVAASRTVGTVPPAQDGLVCVLFPPHEYFVLHGYDDPPTALALARTIFISAEQPGTGHFDRNVELSRSAGAVFDISPLGTRELKRAGLDARRLPVGWTAAWDGGDPQGGRDIDVVFLGCITARRDLALVRLRERLRARRSWLVLSDNSRPNPAGSPGFLGPAQRTALLSRTRVLVNLHQGPIAYGEHLRLVQAASAGCVVVTEPSLGLEPFEAGIHLVVARDEVFGHVLDAVLDDEPLRARIAENAYRLVREEQPLRLAAQALADAALELDVAHPVPTTGPDRPWRGVRRRPQPAPPQWPADRPRVEPLEAALGAIKDMRLDQMSTRRAQERIERAGRLPVTVERSRGWWAARAPRVSALVALFHQGDYLEEALESLTDGPLGRSGAVEAVVVDDGSRDGSGDVARAWSARNPGFPLQLVTHTVNQGLPAARNTALAYARGDACLVLDADNAMEPTGIERLLEALDADPGAAFAYGILARISTRGPEGLLSLFEWDPNRLRDGNFVDALSLIRTAALREAGGYCLDPLLYGWEDYDLWCTFAEREHYGVHVKEIVARYRDSRYSMRAVIDLSSVKTQARLEDRHPGLMDRGVPWPPAVR